MSKVGNYKHPVNIGNRFGRWTVVAPDVRKKGYVYHPCRCDCGTERDILHDSLTSGKSVSCGCYHSEVSKRVCRERNTVHGLYGTKLHRVWRNMLRRCTDQKVKCFSNYGGRGIKVCSEWSVFLTFCEWALANGYREGLEIDRKDNSGNYEPTNCRWVTRKVNARNRRNNLTLEAFGEKKTLVEWSEDSRCLVRRATLLRRVTVGKMTPEKAMTAPLSSGRRSALPLV